MAQYGIGLRPLGKRGEQGKIISAVQDRKGEWIIHSRGPDQGAERTERWTEQEMRSYWKPR